MGTAGRALTGNALANSFYSNAAHADTLAGGGGNDRYSLYHASDRVTEATNGGTDTIYAYANHTLAAGSAVETLYAMGTAGRALTGNALANTLRGGAHADTLAGGGGNDRLFGGAGADRFVFRSTTDSAVGTPRDVISDFTPGQDRIDLSALDANLTLSGNQAFLFKTGPAANSLWLTKSGSALIVRLDLTGDARADMEIGLTGLTTAAKTDFLL